MERHAGRADDHRFRGSEFIREGNGTNDEDRAAGPHEKQVGYQAASRAFDFDLRRPVKPRWPPQILNRGQPGKDAGLAALGHGWPVAAAHGPGSAGGHPEPRRGTEWWGKSVLLTFALYQK